MSRNRFLWLLAGGLLCGSLLAQQPAATLSPSAERMLADVKMLASDEFEGRGVGTAGLVKASEYIAEEFRKAGLNVTVDGGDAFQDFTVKDGARPGAVNELSLSGPTGSELPALALNENWRGCSFGGSGKFSGGLVFAGYGIQDNESGYDDFAGLDVKGKVVIILRNTPFQGNPHGAFSVGRGTSRHAALSTKLSRANTNGAAAVIFVNDPTSVREAMAAGFQQSEAVASDRPAANPHAAANFAGDVTVGEVDALMEFGYGGTSNGTTIPSVHLKQSVVNAILKSAMGKTLEEIEKQIDDTQKPFSQDLTGWSARGEISVEAVTVPIRNVVGVIEGQGPHAEETIVIGAHFDHLGRGEEGSLAPGSKEIHNGADDNASGTAGLIELARRFGSRPQPPARRLVFLAFAGEERGLLGSEHYVANPLVPIENTVAMFNMDMIGRMEDDKLTVFGTGTASQWTKIIADAAEGSGLDLVRKPEGLGPSDHAAFYGKRVPVLHLFTGTHSDYHRPSDDWDKINARDMARIVDLLEKIATAVIDLPQRPEYLRVAGSAILDRAGNRPYFGSIPDFGTEGAGYALQGVSPGGPAERAGLKGGDIIIQMGDKKISNLEDFDLALRDYRAGQTAPVVVKRGDEELKFDVRLTTPR